MFVDITSFIPNSREYAPQRFPRLAAMLLRPVTIAALLALILGWWIARNILGC